MLEDQKELAILIMPFLPTAKIALKLIATSIQSINFSHTNRTMLSQLLSMKMWNIYPKQLVLYHFSHHLKKEKILTVITLSKSTYQDVITTFSNLVVILEFIFDETESSETPAIDKENHSIFINQNLQKEICSVYSVTNVNYIYVSQQKLFPFDIKINIQ